MPVGVKTLGEMTIGVQGIAVTEKAILIVDLPPLLGILCQVGGIGAQRVDRHFFQIEPLAFDVYRGRRGGMDDPQAPWRLR